MHKIELWRVMHNIELIVGFILIALASPLWIPFLAFVWLIRCVMIAHHHLEERFK